MLIKTFQVGHIETNCYIVTDEDTLECAVIDPGDESNTIVGYLEENKLKCRYIFITHGHFDHTMAAKQVSEQTGAPVCIHRLDATLGETGQGAFQFVPDDETIFYKEGDSFNVGSLAFKVMETPGHSPGGVTDRKSVV